MTRLEVGRGVGRRRLPRGDLRIGDPGRHLPERHVAGGALSRRRLEVVGARLVARQAVPDHVSLHVHPLRTGLTVARCACQRAVGRLLRGHDAPVGLVRKAEVRGQRSCARYPGHRLLDLAVMAGGAVGRRGPERLPRLRRAGVTGLAANEERGVLRVVEWNGAHRCGHQQARGNDGGESRSAAGHCWYPTALGMRFTASGKPVRSAPPALNT